MKKTGRPSKRTPETAKLILDGIRAGMTYKHAAQRGGMSYETFNEWRKASVEFSDAVKEADNAMIVRALSGINKAGVSGKWQAWAWLLERRFPEDYGRTRIEVTGKDGAAIETNHTYNLKVLSGEELRTLRESLARAAITEGTGQGTSGAVSN